ncbi:unnamed protein product [Coregonus sp. 'balchen']|nr:unnamed protein product [Coregonus sp. 'balchen']
MHFLSFNNLLNNIFKIYSSCPVSLSNVKGPVQSKKNRFSYFYTEVGIIL